MIFPALNLIKVSKIDLTINIHSINLPSYLTGKKEYPVTSKNNFIFAYDTPIPLSEISLSDLELKSNSEMIAEMMEDNAPILPSKGNLRIGYDGRYYGIYSPEDEKYISFNILILNNFEIRKEKEKYSVYLEFTVSDSVTSFNPSNSRIPKMMHSSHEIIVSEKTQDEIEEEVSEDMANTINSIKIDETDEINALMDGFNLKQ